jgi:Flp pilus assembly CpaE family ATPase
MLDVAPSTDIGHLLRDIDTLDRAKLNDYLLRTEEGLAVLAGSREAANVWEDARPEQLRAIVDLLAVSNDFVVVDTSGAMDRHVRALIDASTLVLLVTTGEVSSVRDTNAGLARLESWGVPEDKVKVVLNRGARAEGFQVNDLEEAIGRPVFWELPRDQAIGRSVQVGRPVVIERPSSPAARNIEALAQAIGGNVANDKRRSSGIGLLKRLRGAPARKVAL